MTNKYPIYVLRPHYCCSGSCFDLETPSNHAYFVCHFFVCVLVLFLFNYHALDIIPYGEVSICIQKFQDTIKGGPAGAINTT